MKKAENIYRISRLKIWETAKSTNSSEEAATKLGIPYKTFAKIAKEMGVYKECERKRDIILNEILRGNHPSYSTTRLKERLIAEGILEYKCSECGIHDWNNKDLVLQLDHIDGNNSNHKLENLRLLCPNCHSQSDTFAGRNNKIE